MPLIDITTNTKNVPTCLRGLGLTDWESNRLVKTSLPEWLARTMADEYELFGLTPDTPFEAFQVMNHTFQEKGLNLPSLWVKIQFGEAPSLEAQQQIAKEVRDALYGWIHRYGFTIKNVAIDIFWSPTAGMISINGVDKEF
jgi:hypothetical protein